MPIVVAESDAPPWPSPLRGGTRLVIAGVARWNRPVVAAMLREVDALPCVVASIVEGLAIAERERRMLIAWAAKLTASDEQCAADAGIDVVRIEDGFMRSVGLGAGLVPGACFALDGRGIHYDAHRPSDIEYLLAHAEVSPDEALLGARLSARIIAYRLSKYNLAGVPSRLPAPSGRVRILVPGQVADDAAVRRTLSATIDLASDNINLALLRAVRQRNPDACIIYKPHPDVVHGLRPGHIAVEEAEHVADVVLADADILDLIAACTVSRRFPR